MVTVGIDIGGTNTKLGLVHSVSGCLHSRFFKTQAFTDGDDYKDRLIAEIEDIVKNYDAGSIRGIGIGAPGVDDKTSRILASENIKWLVNYPLKEKIQKHFRIPVELINDANASAIGEMTFGVAQDYENFLHLTLGTGLGGSVVLDGKVLRGRNGMAGEVGHSNAVFQGRPCNCGKVGCLENYVSASGLKKTALEFLKDSDFHSSLGTIAPDLLSSRDVAEAANSGDPLAMEVFEFTGTLFGRKLAQIVSVLDPEAIIISGGMAAAGEFLLNPTRRSLYEALPDFYEHKVVLKLTGLEHSTAAILGAASQFQKS